MYSTELNRPEYSGLTPEEALDLIRSKTVVTRGVASGADINEIFLVNRLLSLVLDQVNDTGSNSLLRNLCILINKRFLSSPEIDFSRKSNVRIINKFFNELEIQEYLTSIGTTSDAVKTDLFAVATKPLPEFPDVTLRDVLEVLASDSTIPSYSNELDIVGKGNNQFICLEVLNEIPTNTYVLLQISHDGINWDNLGISIPIDKPRKYYRKVLGELIKETSKLRAYCSYNLDMLLSHEVR